MTLRISSPFRNSGGNRLALVALGSACVVLAGATGPVSGASASSGHDDDAFEQVNLVSDLPGLAELTDENVKNPWGIAFGPATPLWVANQFNPASDCGSPDCLPAPEDLLTQTTLYSGAHDGLPITKIPVEVTASSPTGIAFNPTDSFTIVQDGVTTPSRFIFNENVLSDVVPGAPAARVTGWSNVPAPAATTTAGSALKDPALDTGVTVVPGSEGHGPRLLTTDVDNGVVDVYDGDFRKLDRPLHFLDTKALDAGLVPYNVMFLKGRVYVTYAAIDDEVGSVTVFKKDGRLDKRLVQESNLLAGPWGMAIAPEHWGDLGGALLIGNVDNGQIVAFGRRSGHVRGTVDDSNGRPLVNPGLWGIQFGNGVIGTPRTLIFAAGIGEEAGGFGEEIYAHGLVGLIKPIEEDDHDDD